MKITCCWMYAIGKYGFPTPADVMLRAIDEMASLGFAYIELEGAGEDNIAAVIHNRQAIRQACRDAGVKVANFAPILPDVISLDRARQQEAMALFSQAVETAAYLESAFVWIDSYAPPFEIVSGTPMTVDVRFGEQWRVRIPDGFDWPALWAHFVGAMRQCARIARANGLELLIEPRVGEMAPNTDALLRTLEAVGEDNLGVIFDTAHLHAQKETLPLSVQKLGRHIRYVHVADNDGRENYHYEPGTGTIDWEEVFRALKRHGIDGHYAVDLEKMPDLEERFLSSKRFLEGWAERMGL